MASRPTIAQAVHRHPGLLDLFRGESISTLISNACVNLATLFGITLEEAQKTSPFPMIAHLPEHLQLKMWRDGRYVGEIQAVPIIDSYGQLRSLEYDIRVEEV